MIAWTTVFDVSEIINFLFCAIHVQWHADVDVDVNVDSKDLLASQIKQSEISGLKEHHKLIQEN